MAPEDRALAERVHVTVTATAPELSPKTWYGMPAYANADGKVVVFFQNSGKFNYRYSTLGFQDAANLDDGDLWPVSYALQKWSPAVEQTGRPAGAGRSPLTTGSSPVPGRAELSAVADEGLLPRKRAPCRAAAAGVVVFRTWQDGDDSDSGMWISQMAVVPSGEGF